MNFNNDLIFFVQVQPKHVKEAFRLLNKSIIRVDQPDIHLEEGDENEDEEEMEVDSEPPAQTNGHVNGTIEDVAEPSGSPQQDKSPKQSAPKKSLKLSYEDYKHMANLLVLNMRRMEDEMEEKGSTGCRRSELVGWYLREIENEIESEAELIERKTIVMKVIERLVHHDNILIELKHTQLMSKSKTEDPLETEDDPYLVVHPNYVIDS